MSIKQKSVQQRDQKLSSNIHPTKTSLKCCLLVSDRTDAGRLLKCSAPWNSNEFWWKLLQGRLKCNLFTPHVTV